MNGRYSDNDPSGYDRETMDRGGDNSQDHSGEDIEREDDDDTEDREDDDDPEDNDIGRDEHLERKDVDNPEDSDNVSEEDDEDDGNDVESKGSRGEEYDDEYYDEEAYYEDDQIQKEEEEDDRRSRCLYLSLCCCCLLLIIAAIVIGILLSKKRKSENAPTAAPTVLNGSSFPTIPTGSGSVPPFVEEYPNGDTTVYKDGPLQSQPQGEQDIMLVQNGESQDPNFPDTYALMNWKWDEVGYPWFNEDDLADYDVAGLMCLEHIPNTNEGSDKNITYSICRLPSSFPGDELETSTSTGYKYIMPTDCMDQQKIDFDVAPTDEIVCIDATPLINVHPPFVATGTSPNKRRGLQENNFQNMLFMLDNLNSEQRATDEFYTRQAGDRSPTLRLTMTPKRGGGGSGNGNEGTSAPNFNSGGGSSPAMAPTISNAPSISSAPSVYTGPTISPAPTGNYTFPPCGVCGDGPAGAPLREDYDVLVRPEIAPDSIVNGMATCAEIEEICLAGECNAAVCSELAEVRQACGCPGAGGPTLCSICPVQTTMTKPDEDIRDVLSPYASPGMLEAAGGDVVTCADFDELCTGGQCGSVCMNLTDIASESCGCTPTPGSGSGPPSPSSDKAPTGAPTMSDAPSTSAAPTYKAEFEFCGICGIGPTPNPLTDVPIEIPDNLAPPQVKDGEATCAELESYCQEGYCRPLTCRVLEPIRGLCGCPNADPPCSICGPGKVISNTNGALNLDPTLTVPGYDQTTTCGQLNDLCAKGYCSESLCTQYPDVVTQTCGCTDTIPDFALFSSSDTTIYPNGTLSAGSFGEEDTMLVQGGLSNDDELPPALSLIEFTVSDTDFQDVQRYGFAIIELCLHHVVSTQPDRVVTYRTCIVPNVDGLELANGETVDYSIPSSCAGGKVSQFTVTPSAERVCTKVTDMIRENVSGPTIITFMVDAADSSNQPGDRFYTQEDPDGRKPTVQFVDKPYDMN
jgi:hypothetical protein